MSKKISLALISLLAFPASVSALGEDNARLQELLQRARARHANYQQRKAAPVTKQPFIPQEAVQAPVEAAPVLVPESIEHKTETVHDTPPAAVVEEHHHAPEAHETTHHAQAHHQDRAPRVLETHPKKEEPRHEEVHKPEPVHPAPAPIVHKREPQVQVKTEHKVSQPPVQTHTAHGASSIHTETVTSSTVHTSHEAHGHEISTHHEETSHTEEAEHTEHKTTDEVTVFLNQVLGGGKAPVVELEEEKFKPVAEEEHAAEESHSEHKVEEHEAEPIPGAPALEDAPVETLAAQPEEELTKENSQALNLSDQESDYLLIVRKSLKSLEDDPWVKVKNNMDEAIGYFEKEKKIGTDEDVDVYQKIVLACKRFSEGGLELDEGDFADFEEAEALYLDTQDLLEQAKKQVRNKTDYKNSQLNEIIDALLGYTEEELQYIEEMLGM
ncbi:MAG: hypothetical protein OXU45_09475 [Candidatus Melainabacteria bacterium]|nr:hypothetical protein [Candidatus Melainabacteria bacterium]